MAEFLYGYKEQVGKFVADMIPHARRGFGPSITTLGVIDDEGRLIAGIVYHNYDPEAEIIEISGAAVTKRWLDRPTLQRMFDIPFVEMGLQMVIMRITSRDKALQRMLRAYGFELFHMKRLFGREKDGYIATLTDEAWAGNKFNSRSLSDDARAVPAATHEEAA